MSILKTSMTPQRQPGDDEDSKGRPSSLAGLILLTEEGSLARLDEKGRPAVVDTAEDSLQSQINAVLKQYRSGVLAGLSLGLVADKGLEPGRGAGTLIFSNWVLKELFQSGRTGDTPLTMYEQRNKFKTVYQGMELLLNKQRPVDSPFSHYCPVLIVPEMEHDALCERYGVDFVERPVLYELMDLGAPGDGGSHAVRGALMNLIEQMRASQTERPAYHPVASPEEDDGRGQDAATRGASLHAVPAAPGANTCFADGDPVTGWLLEWFSPFNELTDTQREIIAGYETIRKARAGTRLIAQGASDDICIYLVEGTLALASPDGETMRVTGGTRRSRLPISVLTPHAHDVTALSDASIIVFSQRLITKLNEITRTYTSVNRGRVPASTTAEISNGVQAAYLSHAEVNLSPRET